MSDKQYENLTEWVGDRFGDFMGFVGNTFSDMSVQAWSIAAVAAVVIGFLCMRGMRASERM